MASGWNLWVWLECIGVASGYCCKEVHVHVYTYVDILIIITFPYSTYVRILALFLAAASLHLRLFLKCFFILYSIEINGITMLVYIHIQNWILVLFA